MSSFDINQARTFLKLLGGDAEKPYQWQSFHDSKTSVDNYKKPETFFAKLDDCIEYFNGVNTQNYGIYVCLNKTDGKGREDHNITGYRLVFADVDNAELPTFPIQPHMITQRDALHSHAYWLVEGIVTSDQFKRLQKQTALYLNTDEQVCDPTRVVRVAGSYNMKNPATPAMYNIVSEVADKTPYTLDQINAAFTLTGEKLTKLNQWCDSRNSLDSGHGFNEDPINRTLLISFLGRAEPAIYGSGSMTLIRVSSYGYDLGVPLSECQEIMWEHYDHRCIPSWHDTGEQRGFNDIVERAYKYANNVAGCRTCTGKFSALRAVEPLAEPTGGWEANAKLGKLKADNTPTLAFVSEELVEPDGNTDNEVLSTVDAAALMAQLTNKSPIWDMARVFIATKYPNGGLIRCDKIYYEFTGRYWKEIKDDAIRSNIVWFFAQWKLPPSKISNILTSVEDAVYKKDLQNCTWLKGDYDGLHTVVFNNTLVELKDEVKMLEHTRNYFCMNELGYDYDPTSQCPEFIKFLNTIWDDQNIILKLQEWFGYSLTTDAIHQKIAMFIGKSRGGKGVITTILSKMLGEHNTVSPTMENIIQNSMIHAMSKAKLILIPEATDIHPSKRNEVLGNLKAISGNDPLSYHVIYKGAAINHVWGKIVISTNSMPTFVDSSGALANRFEIFPFMKSFVGREDKELGKRLEKEISGILNWAIEGLRRLQSQGQFTSAEQSVEMVDDMRRDMFPLAEFVETYCVIGTDHEIKIGNLYDGYLHYCRMNEIKMPIKKTMFGKYLKSSYLPVNPNRLKDEARSRGFSGIDLNAKVKVLLKPSGTGTGTVVGFPSIAPPTIIKEKLV